MAYIYIATNETLWYNDNGVFRPLIKIGYTSQDDIDQRLNQLNHTTSAAGPFEKFASYEIAPIPGAMPDKLVHKIIQSINPALRLNENKEYFIWKPEDAYQFFKNMAKLHGCEDKLVRYDGEQPAVPPATPLGGRLPPVNMTQMGIPEGAVLHYKADPAITCVVRTGKTVEYNGHMMSLTALAQLLKGTTKAIAGPRWFTWQGKTVAGLWRAYWEEALQASSD